MSEVTICNLALSHIGDTASVTSIKPPDSSAQAQHCARYYYVARNALLEMSSWGFATRRIVLSRVANPAAGLDADGDSKGMWRYAYALPAATINILAVLPANARDDYEEHAGRGEWLEERPWPQGHRGIPDDLRYTPQPFAIETDVSGAQIVLTNVCDAVLRYTTLVEDTTKFSPLFTLALSYLLASMLAGPIIKGDAGAELGAQMLQMFKVFKDQATASDANQRKTNVKPAVPWIGGR